MLELYIIYHAASKRCKLKTVLFAHVECSTRAVSEHIASRTWYTEALEL